MGNATTGRQILELERQYWTAIKDGDAETAMRLSDDPCVVAGAQGFAQLPRQALGAMFDKAKYTLERFEIGEGAVVRMIGDDVAIVAYKVHEELTVDGKPVTLEGVDSSTWVRRDGRWLCALHTEAIAGDPFGRDRRATTAGAPG